VSHFEEASKLYKLSKAFDKEIAALKLSIQCNENLHDNWAVARNYEAIVTCWIENNPNLNI